MSSTNKYTYDSTWINKLESERHWRQYWFQLKILERYLVDNYKILEIGCGSGLVANYLKTKGYSITTLDIDKGKKPDIVANLVEYEYPESYDFILAFEVFEHVPFDEFKVVVKKLNKACKDKLFLSVPYNEKVMFHGEVYMPVIGNKVIHIAKKRNEIIENHHHWELGYNVSEKEFYQVFYNSGFKLLLKKKNWIYNYSVFIKF